MEQKVRVNKKPKELARAELEEMSKSDLIERILQLDAHVTQLKNILHKKLHNETTTAGSSNNHKQIVIDEEAEEPKRKATKKRQFDFSKCHTRHILLKVLYFGWDYRGLACQEDSNDTIEHHLFEALTRTCLIESRATANYHRCGRTDKEVSAFCQVISIDVRSKYAEEKQLNADELANEIDYCGVLNRILPCYIKCVAWMPLRSKEYSARFDCLTRTYRYYFPKGDLDIDMMRAACPLLERHADFRNFCKMDVNNGVVNFVRHIVKARIEACDPKLRAEAEGGYSMFYLEIQANAFLWHQIRCIMAILLLIGSGKEDPSLISNLFDIEDNPCKPQYSPALGLPLNLFHCDFRERSKTDEDMTVPGDANAAEMTHTTAWIMGEQCLRQLIVTLQGEWTQFSVKCTMLRDVLQNLESFLNSVSQTADQPVRSQHLPLQMGSEPRQYQKLLERKRCESLESRIEHYVKKQRLVAVSSAAATDS